MAATQFVIRPSVPCAHDESFILAAFDSTLPYLESMGNGAMWGHKPFSEKESFVEDSKNDLKQAQRFRETGEGERLLTFIAEIEEPGLAGDGCTLTRSDRLHRRVDDQGRTLLAVGIMDVRDEEFADHLGMIDALRPVVENATKQGRFAYVDMLAGDQRSGTRCKGVGSALIAHAKEYARQQGKESLYIDCWTGGTGNLVKFYERLGFVPVANYEFPRKDGTIWPGRLFRMQI